MENHFGPGKSWKLKLKVLDIRESRAFFYWFKWNTSSNSTSPSLCWLLLTSGSEKVLENFSWGSWKVLDFFVS